MHLPFVKRSGSSLLRQAVRGLSSMTQHGFIASPRHYGANFRIPVMPKDLPLETANKHPNDEFVRFEEDKHRYSINGKEISTSVTTLLSSYFSEFNAEEIANKMVNGRNWPREGYKHMDGTPYSVEEIMRKWDDVARVARNRGIWMHHNIERYFNNMPTATDIPELKQFTSFVADVIQGDEIVPYRTEWRIGSDVEDIAGTVDFVGRCPDGTYALFDWKRMKNVRDSLNNAYGQRARAPLYDYDDCDGVKYFLQLNVYKYLLEKYYNITVSRMNLVSLHPMQEDYAMVHVPHMEEEVKAIFATRNL